MEGEREGRGGEEIEGEREVLVLGFLLIVVKGISL